MKTLNLSLHRASLDRRKIAKAVASLRQGAVLLYPTDTGFALGCELSNKVAINRLRTLRRLSKDKALTFLCHCLSNVAEFANVSNLAYRTVKRLIPGPYTFILPASKMVPRYAQDPKRKTTGIRVPDHPLCQALLAELGVPLLSITAKTEDGEYLNEPEELIDYFTRRVDVVMRLDSYDFLGESTVVNMTTDEFSIIREGAGFDEVADFIEFVDE